MSSPPPRELTLQCETCDATFNSELVSRPWARYSYRVVVCALVESLECILEFALIYSLKELFDHNLTWNHRVQVDTTRDRR